MNAECKHVKDDVILFVMDNLSAPSSLQITLFNL